MSMVKVLEGPEPEPRLRPEPRPERGAGPDAELEPASGVEELGIGFGAEPAESKEAAAAPAC